MAILKTIILGNISVELAYHVTPYEPAVLSGTKACPAVEAKVVFSSDYGDQVMISDSLGRVDIQLDGALSDSEWGRLEEEAWHDYNNHPSTP